MNLRRWFFGSILSLGLIVFVPNVTHAADWVNIGFSGRSTQAVMADRTNKDHIVASLVSNGSGDSMYYTYDGGTTWIATNTAGWRCESIVQNPKLSAELWTGCYNGLFRSLDGGKSFVNVLNWGPSPYNISISETGVRYYAYGNKIFRSYDGIVWETCTLPGFGGAIVKIAVNPKDGNEVVINKTDVVSRTTDGLYRSTDAGVTWARTSTVSQITNGLNGIYFMDNGVLCASHITNGISYSADNGFTWSTFVTPNPIPANEHNKVYTTVQNPDVPDNIIAASIKQKVTYPSVLFSMTGTDSSKTVISDLPDGLRPSAVSQGIVFAGSNNLSGLWRNDGVATQPEYLTKHPIIIVPGILGSWETSGGHLLDPFFHTYDGLYMSFVNAGYEPGKLLFDFPYNWRNDNRDTAILLKQKIDEAKALSGSSKVELIAHSMGGLVARSYIEDDNYGNDVNRIFFLGTPQLGSVDSFFLWEGGYTGYIQSMKSRAIMEFLLHEEAVTSGFIGNYNVLNYVHEKVKSVEQLLPIFPYKSGTPNSIPENNFLQNLNDNLSSIANRGVKVVNIISDNGNNTIKNMTTVVSTDPFGWIDGMPSGFSDGNFYSGIELGRGDDTVLLSSQSAVPGLNHQMDSVTHQQIPNYSTPIIFDELGIAGQPLITETINKYMFIKAYSPVDFYVTSPSGKKIGFNENGSDYAEISGAFYSGARSAAEFVTIPNPETGQYQIITKGNNTGKYKIESSYIDESTKTERTTAYEGITALGSVQIVETVLAADGSTDTEVQDEIAPVTNISQDVPTAEFYSTDIVVSLTAQDDISGVKTTEYSTDNLNWQEYTVPVTVSNEDENRIYYRSTDYAGNVEMAKEATFVIDRTPPAVNIGTDKSIYTHFESLHLSCVANDNLSGVSEVTVRLDGNVVTCENLMVSLDKYTNGSHGIVYIAVDKAGNSTSGQVSFNVVTTFASAQLDLVRLFTQGEIRRSTYAKYSALLSVVDLLKKFGLVKQSNTILDLIISSIGKDKKLMQVSEYAYNLIGEDVLWLRNR